jgi:hypothetical protein
MANNKNCLLTFAQIPDNRWDIEMTVVGHVALCGGSDAPSVDSLHCSLEITAEFF